MMSSGVQFFHGLGRPNRDDMYFDMFVRHHNLDTFAASLARRVPPLTDWNYLATDTHVLSAVLRGAYHEGTAQILHDKLWQPAGFGSYATWSKHADGPQGVVFGHCCLQLRLIDFALLGQLYEENFVVNGRSIVPDGWADMATRPNAPFQEPGDKPRGYAMQFWVPKDYDKEAMALGAFGQILWIDRKHHVVVAQFAANGNHPPSEAEENAAFRAIVFAVAKR
jgi:CubicO group peptidase (beta-lactamase class C family)